MQNKIYLDLNESPYKTVKSGICFTFSSPIYLEKFEKIFDKYIKEETMKIYNKYKVQGYFVVFLAISLYKKIEKRGFKVYDEISKKEISEKIQFVNSILTY